MNSQRHVKIFDTTLRDGQQCPGAGMSADKNLEYAALARKLRVDVLEAGFPSASSLDFQIVHQIASDYASREWAPTVAALCQLRREQIEKTIEALRPAIPVKRARLHTYVPVSPELMEASLGERAQSKEQIIRDVFELISIAVAAGCEVQFSPEGYSRVGNNFDFCTDLIRAAVDAGATVINCPDTIGGACPQEGEHYFVNNMNRHAAIIRQEFPYKEITWSVHCHNDFGLAVSNSINGVFNGPARQIEGCINGIGERAGNAALEQCIMLIRHFGHTAAEPFFTTIDTEHLQAISDFVGRNMLPRQPHWPVCGENAARHSSGGHTNAILRNPLAYQPFDPGEVGKQVSLVFGPLSGGNHAQAIIRSHGFICEESEKAAIAQFIKDRFKQRRKGITDSELMTAYFDYRAPMQIDSIDYSRKQDRSEVMFSGSFNKEAVRVRQEIEGKDSALAALKMVLETYFDSFEILAHWSESEGAGISAVSKSHIEIIDQKKNRYVGTGHDQDIEISAMRALIDACNRWYVMSNYTVNEIENVSQSVEMPQAVRLSAAS
jgi:2-isopropylmalate synthase